MEIQQGRFGWDAPIFCPASQQFPKATELKPLKSKMHPKSRSLDSNIQHPQTRKCPKGALRAGPGCRRAEWASGLVELSCSGGWGHPTRHVDKPVNIVQSYGCDAWSAIIAMLYKLEGFPPGVTDTEYCLGAARQAQADTQCSLRIEKGHQ